MNRTDVRATLAEMWETRPSRPGEGAEIAGVAAAVARRYAIDPVLVRIGFVVTASFGAGALLYIAGWALLPAEEGANRVLQRPRPWLAGVLVIVALIGFGSLFGDGAFFGGAILPTLVVLGLLFALHRSRAGLGSSGPAGDTTTIPAADDATAATHSPASAPLPAAGESPAVQPPAWDPLGAAPFAWDLPEPGTADPAAPPPQRRAPVTAVTLAAALLAGGVTALAMLIGGRVDLPVLAGVVLAVLGTGLSVGAFLRSGRGLIPIAAMTAVLTWGLLAAPWVRFDDTEHIRIAPTVASGVLSGYQHPAGIFELDLSALDLTGTDPAGSTATDPLRTGIDLGAGQVRVIVAPDADVALRASAGLGRVAFDGRAEAGAGPELVVPLDLGADGIRSGRLIELDVELGMGNVEVHRG